MGPRALGFFSRKRLAKGSCCVRLPLGPSCLSHGGCGCVAAAVAGALPPQSQPIGNLYFLMENQGFRGVGEAVAGPGPGPGPGPAEGILSILVILVHLGDFGLRPVIWEC